MTDTRYKNRNWVVETSDNGRVDSHHMLSALLMDIRDELWAINDKMNGENFQKAIDSVNEIGRLVRRRNREAYLKARDRRATAAMFAAKKRKGKRHGA